MQRTLLTALALYGALPSLVLPVEGSYVVRTMNGNTLPAKLRIPTTEGDFRLFELEQGVLTLKPDGRFSLHFRYYHQLVQRGTRPMPTPVRSDSETGTYRITKGKLLLRPVKKERAHPRPNIEATLVGQAISASYTLANGTIGHKVTLVFRRDARFW